VVSWRLPTPEHLTHACEDEKSGNTDACEPSPLKRRRRKEQGSREQRLRTRNLAAGLMIPFHYGVHRLLLFSHMCWRGFITSVGAIISSPGPLIAILHSLGPKKEMLYIEHGHKAAGTETHCTLLLLLGTTRPQSRVTADMTLMISKRKHSFIVSNHLSSHRHVTVTTR